MVEGGGDDPRDLVVRLAERAEDVIYRFRLKPEPGWDYMSPAIERLTGYSAGEYYADWELVVRTMHPDDRASLAGSPEAWSLAGRNVHRWIRKDGAVVWVEHVNVVIVDDSGDPVALEGVARNITERMRAEEERRDRERTLHALFEQTGVPMLVFDDERRYLDGNRAACELLGVTREELPERRIDDFTPAEYLPELERVWGEFVTEGSVRTEYKLLRSDGATRDAELTATANIGPGRHLVAFVDITKGRQLELELHEAHKLEAVGRLAGGVAHDFNNQLAAIRLYCDLIRSHVDDPKRVRSEIDGIAHVTDLASELTSQLLAFGRRQLLQPRVLDLNTVVEQAEEMLRRQLGSAISLVVELSPGLHPVQADPAQLELVLGNLALNSRDAMPEGGTLTICTDNVDRGGTPCVLVAVSDTGAGMDEATRSQIFEPFFTTKGLVGTGLGLASVYGIVTQTGGSIEVTSEPGSGTTFSIYLPRSEAHVEAREPAEERGAAEGTETILLVDDEDVVRDVAAEVLSAAGYQVVAATDGAEALELAERHGSEIAVLVTDLKMPGMGGVELVGRLRDRYPKLAVVFTSGYADAAAFSPEQLSGASAFVEKPFSTDELARAIRAVLDIK